jgi:hypothetical protein
MAHSMPSSSRKLETTASDNRLVEVWGDTVDIGHLGKAIVIGGVVSLTCYFVASRVLATFVDTPDRARAYAMLVGLAGCLVSGFICARLFPPKREVVQDAIDPFWREEVLAQMVAEYGTIGSVTDLPPATVQELKELGLYELFASHDRMNAEDVPSTEEVLRREMMHRQPTPAPGQ